MAMIYEVWDTLTSNRIGAFATLHDAEALMFDVLRANGVQAARDLAVLGSNTDAPDGEPQLVLDGVDFVARGKVAV